MKFRDKVYDRYDKACDAVERVDLAPAKHIAVPVLFVIVAVICILYCVGAWDFTFIDRPERVTELPAYVPEEEVTEKSDETTKAPEKVTEEVQTDAPESVEPVTEEVPEIHQMSDLCSEGYYVSDKTYDPAAHKIAILNVDLGAAKEYSVRERNVYAPEFYSDYEYGETKVRYVQATEPRPSLEAYMGKLYADNGTNVIIFDAYGDYYGNYDESFYFGYTRTRDGEPLYYLPTTYKAYTYDGEYADDVQTKKWYTMGYGGWMTESDYVDEIDGRGLHMDYPAWYATETGGIERKCIVNTVNYLTLKNQLTGWTRTVWGYFDGETDDDGNEISLVDGWYDVEAIHRELEENPIDTSKWDEWDWKDHIKAVRAAEKTRIYSAFNFSEGFAAVANENGQMWFIDKKGKQTFDCIDLDNKYNAAGRRIVENLLLPLTDGIESLGFYYFDHGLCRVRRQTYDYYQVWDYNVKRTEFDDDELIYPNGEKFTVAEGYDIVSYSDGMILLEKGGKYGYMDYTGAWMTEPKLTGGKPFLEGLAACAKNGRWGVIDTAGRTVVPFDYDAIQTISSGVIVAHSGRGWTVFAKMEK